MNNSTKRAIRTAVQGLFALAAVLLVAVPIVGQALPAVAAIGGSVAVAAATLAKLWNALEDKGLIPSWLRDADSVGTTDANDYFKVGKEYLPS